MSHITITAFGDLMLSRNVDDLIQLDDFKIGDEIVDLCKGSDIIFGNLESVLSDKGSPRKCKYCFRGDPLSIKVLRNLSVTDVSVANNHMADYGYDAWLESNKLLSEAGINPIGDYYNLPDPKIRSIKDQVFAFFAFDTRIRELNLHSLKLMIQAIQEKVDYIIVSMHWGREYQHRPDKEIINLAHYLVDLGINIIIGHHPHDLQTIEKYNNGLIIYSMGNFIFDQVGFDRNESMIIQLVFEGNKKHAVLVPIGIEHTMPRIATTSERNYTLKRLSLWSPLCLREEVLGGIVNF